MKTHDYTNRSWGHDVFWHVLDSTRLKLTGWGEGIGKGDYMILPNGGDTTRYRIDEIRYATDPRDMFTAIASFAPRK